MDWIRRFTRLARIRAQAARRPTLRPDEVSIVRDRVWLTDLDELRHMNNGVYLSLLDHARLDLTVRTGAWARLRAAGIYLVVTAQSITYRRSLELGQRFEIQSRVAGYDDRCVYVEQRVVARGEIVARAHIQGRFLRDSGGVVPVEEAGGVIGVDPATHPIPEWLRAWAENVRLPSTREPAPSDWRDPAVGGTF